MVGGPQADGARRIIQWPERRPVAMRLLKVVTDDLFVFGETLGESLFQPDREPLMQLRALQLRKRVVRRVADEDVAKTERIARTAMIGPHQLLADQCRDDRRGARAQLLG